ncbi:P-loop containing nucleoside triphosphate hydrolase protein [Penicillium daleae]|uniref:P-loop containing nucleoside triphosphate hydrolase protein n=1 Tax=Penicillium daleae TaxID=63821 RepID=A0AAD6C1Q5_9EURO|nr:P-loop containing nucleoside triphosphate hydrolase protein [Penicillium daleae]KAJ5440243.1 P-loop containing nucleoside triphosphate hydrolase protein [Penicillium daleae]
MATCAHRENLSMIVVMGATGSDKSYFINCLAGREVVQEGHSLDPCWYTTADTGREIIRLTEKARAGPQECQLVPVHVGRSKVLLLNTPDFGDAQRTDSEILTEIAQILSAQYQLGVELKGIIYIHSITDVRYSRSSVTTFEIFKNICGERALHNALLVTSRWNEVSESIGAERERALRDRFWAYMLRRGSHLSRFHGDHNSAVSLVSQLLMKETVVLELQGELVREGKQLGETAAGMYINGNIEEKSVQQQITRKRSSLTSRLFPFNPR